MDTLGQGAVNTLMLASKDKKISIYVDIRERIIHQQFQKMQ